MEGPYCPAATALMDHGDQMPLRLSPKPWILNSFTDPGPTVVAPSSTTTTLHTCPESGCDRTFGQKKTLNRHHRSVHLQNSQSQCPMCDAVFKRKDARDRHMKEQHEKGAGSVQCEKCGNSVGTRAMADHQKSRRCRKGLPNTSVYRSTHSARHARTGAGMVGRLTRVMRSESRSLESSDVEGVYRYNQSPQSRTMAADDPLLAGISALVFAKGLAYSTGSLLRTFRVMALALGGLTMRCLRQHVQCMISQPDATTFRPDLYLAILALAYNDVVSADASARMSHQKMLRTVERLFPGSCSVEGCGSLMDDAMQHCIGRLPSLICDYAGRIGECCSQDSKICVGRNELERLCQSLFKAHRPRIGAVVDNLDAYEELRDGVYGSRFQSPLFGMNSGAYSHRPLKSHPRSRFVRIDIDSASPGTERSLQSSMKNRDEYKGALRSCACFAPARPRMHSIIFADDFTKLDRTDSAWRAAMLKNWHMYELKQKCGCQNLQKSQNVLANGRRRFNAAGSAMLLMWWKSCSQESA